jgi:hypothetical protein
MKKNGATAEQIAKVRMKAEQDVRDVELAASKEREKQKISEYKASLKNIDAAKAVLATTKAGSDKYREQLKVVNDLIKAHNGLVQSINDERQSQTDLIMQSDEAIQKEKDAAKQRAKEAATAARERADKQREAIRQAEDSALALVKEGIEKQRQTINTSYTRQIEDLQRKLDSEKNLTQKAREAINTTIQNLEKQKQAELDKLSDEETKKRIENETKLIELRLQSVKQGGEAEYQLRLQQLAKQEEAELNNTELTEEMKAAIRAKYEKQYDDFDIQKRAKTLADQKAAIDLEWRQRLDGVMQGSLEESNLKLQQAQAEYDALLNMDAAQKEAIYGTGLEADTAYTNALLDNKAKLADAEKSNREAIMEATQTQLNAAQTIGNGFEELLNTLAEDNEAFAGFAKAMALFNIGLDIAKAIASIPSMAAAGDPYTYALRVATSIATVMTSMAKAYQLLNKEKQPKAPKFAAGGPVSGAGSGTSDSIPANLSNGESVLTAPATAMFAPLLSAFNQIGGGIPVTVAETSRQVIGEEMLARAFARGMAQLPPPVVSVEEINSVNTRVKVLENLSRQ